MSAQLPPVPPKPTHAPPTVAPPRPNHAAPQPKRKIKPSPPSSYHEGIAKNFDVFDQNTNNVDDKTDGLRKRAPTTTRTSNSMQSRNRGLTVSKKIEQNSISPISPEEYKLACPPPSKVPPQLFNKPHQNVSFVSKSISPQGFEKSSFSDHSFTPSPKDRIDIANYIQKYPSPTLNSNTIEIEEKNTKDKNVKEKTQKVKIASPEKEKKSIPLASLPPPFVKTESSSSSIGLVSSPLTPRSTNSQHSQQNIPLASLPPVGTTHSIQLAQLPPTTSKNTVTLAAPPPPTISSNIQLAAPPPTSQVHSITLATPPPPTPLAVPPPLPPQSIHMAKSFQGASSPQEGGVTPRGKIVLMLREVQKDLVSQGGSKKKGFNQGTMSRVTPIQKFNTNIKRVNVTGFALPELRNTHSGMDDSEEEEIRGFFSGNDSEVLESAWKSLEFEEIIRLEFDTIICVKGMCTTLPSTSCIGDSILPSF
ncbi:hypothetical protein EIN_485980 [Entamoeba invadens IP1]|uniref:Uncharacterized protein n=1 Tax=Entamoeba invadens IP1 TaxID=370355 RepID=A0A0A1U4L7_ENTIV|nr:hypothetical protein EIN_485980 [Entamoeba invadens IP1]ELP89196.1 hypothetical protein EIN_485980 [Entamoeba invadens IP1]|eukprot:XP_004255967.1 hypothetical protein EIN_485980 [Entamoeba invadens IP1]